MTPGLQPPLHAERKTLCGLIDGRVQMVGSAANPNVARRLQFQGQRTTVPGPDVGRIQADGQVLARTTKAADRGEHPVLDVGPDLGCDWFVSVDRDIHSWGTRRQVPRHTRGRDVHTVSVTSEEV